MDDSFALYLANVLTAKYGFAAGTVPEAEKLAGGGADFVLTRSDGLTFSAVCIVDAERDPSRRFGLTRSELIEIGKACRAKYSGRLSGAKTPAIIEIIEVRASVSAADLERLRPLRSRFGALAFAYAVDLSAGTVAVNVWSLANPRLTMLRRLLKEPRLLEDRLEVPAPAAAAAVALPSAKVRPLLTILMMAALAAVFVVEQLVPVAPNDGPLEPSVKTLVALGGLSRPLVLEQGEWFRLFTAALLHGGPAHLLFNAIALLLAGVVLEPLVGRAWFFALFFLGALGGSLMSLGINPANIVSIGASGAIMGLLAGALVLALRFPAGAQRTAIYTGLLRVFIPSMIPLAVRSGERIDFAAHLGGALVGALFGILLLRSWPRTSPRPRFAGAAVALALSAAAVFAWSGRQAHAAYARYSLGRLLIPKEQLPKTDDELAARALTLVSTYPRDPRARFYRAVALSRANDHAGAEAELRRGLAEKELLQSYFTRDLEVLLRSALAQTLLAQKRVEDAKREAQPVCHAGPDGSVPELLKPLHLCP